MNQSQNPLFTTKKPKRIKKPSNFAEALLEIGGQTVRTAKDAVTGVATQSVDTLVGNTPTATGELRPDRTLDIEAKLQQQEVQIRQEQARIRRHQETIQTTLYSREEQETKLQIKAIQNDLKKFAEEIGQMESSVERAIEEEVIEPGTYHVNFFVKLRQFIAQLRKRVSESKNWFALSSQRKKHKNYYWGNVKKSGTKFMLSQERYMSTQAG